MLSVRGNVFGLFCCCSHSDVVSVRGNGGGIGANGLYINRYGDDSDDDVLGCNARDPTTNTINAISRRNMVEIPFTISLFRCSVL